MDQKHNENNESREDHPIKHAAMATFGALSSAVEKVADVIGDAVSKENREKYAKKGEETISHIKDTGEDVFRQVKDFSTQTLDKVKSAMEDPLTKPHTTPDSASEALDTALEALAQEAAEARAALKEGMDDDQAGHWAGKLSQSIQEHAQTAARLARHLQALTHRDDAPAAQGVDTYFDKPVDGDIPYESPTAPIDESDRIRKPPADPEQAYPYSPDKDSNTHFLETNLKNQHLRQSVPPERG